MVLCGFHVNTGFYEITGQGLLACYVKQINDGAKAPWKCRNLGGSAQITSTKLKIFLFS